MMGRDLCRNCLKWLVFLLLFISLTASGVWARPTTPDEARAVVENWLALDAMPLGAPLGRQVESVDVIAPDRTRDDIAKETGVDASLPSEPVRNRIKGVETYTHQGAAAYYVVYLNPAGFVIVSADDLVEPIVGFLPAGRYDPSADNPLGAMVSRDLPGRVLAARQVEKQVKTEGLQLAPNDVHAVARRKWALLADPAAAIDGAEFGLPSVSSVRVPPLVQSKWNQSLVGGAACYNYYTPPHESGNVNNYVCGCVATAMAQLMRFWSHPTTGVGTGSHTIYVNGSPTTRSLRGGDGAGGSYDWGNMPLVPSSGMTLAQRQAIGALTADAGVSVNMDYTSSGSGTDTLNASAAFVNTFGYSNARNGYSGGASSIPAANRNDMVNPNLDAGFPTLLGITGSAGGHAIVCDGYGYNAGTLYHHLNMGWSGSEDAWYNLPTVDTSWTTFDVHYKVVYNVYKTGSGEIISGRVTDTGGNPIGGVTVSAGGPGGPYTATTNANGIYALPGVLSNSTYTVTAVKSGHTFSPQTVTTGTSTDFSITTGNRWGVNFMAASPAGGVVLFDNGPLVNKAGAGAGGADLSVLQSSLGMTTYGFGHQVFDNNRIADDFTLKGRARLRTIKFYAYQTGSTTTSTIDAVNLRIWSGPPNDPASTVLFGDTTTNRLTGTTWSNIYRVVDTAEGSTQRPIMVNTVSVDVTLDPGTYWLDWQTGGSLASGPWAPPITINGQTTTGNALQFSAGSGSWAEALDSGTLTSQGFPFIIEGEREGIFAPIKGKDGTTSIIYME